ncbi:uncharacterized protein SOCEGT47_074540 [Sorangium cellulosum]|uniref:phosphoglycolate phosphatase n=1 Tax=Sorangium cellulosum TaxID=56 RepID=A0A4P2QB21_SORCE|nr:HAD-IA family hydrolase [Sorangium cellulosum]AUX26884.1 uncharacterized protein SOCEGT47_074540 [Sorangium cellulosum]
MLRDKNVTALVFDLDGVIVDSEPVMRLAYTMSCAEHGVVGAPPIEHFLRYMGMPLEAILATLRLPAAMAETYRKISRESLDRVTMYPGAFKMVVAARERLPALGLMTGKDRLRTLEILERFKLRELFDLVVCGDDPFPGKPHPDGLAWMIRQFGVSPGSVVMLGDSSLDIACCLAAGAVPCGALWGFSSAADLSQATAVFGSVEQFHAWITGASARHAAESVWQWM